MIDAQERRIELLDSAQEYIASARTRNKLLMFQMLAVIIFIFSIYVVIRVFVPRYLPFAPLLAFSAMLFLVLPVLIWRNPRTGFYIIVACATLFLQVAQSADRDPTAYVPIFWNVSTIVEHYSGSGGLGFVHFNPGEVIMLMTIVFWLIRQIVMRELKIERGVLFNWLGMYVLFCCWGFVQGMLHGGVLTFALTEMRAQVYLFVCYMMAVNLIKTRQHAINIIWIMLIGIGIKGVIGTINYAKNTDVTADEGVLNHEDSLLMNILLFGTLLFSLANVERKLKWTFLAFSPFALLSLLANGRRAGIASFVVALPVVLALSYVLLRERRRAVLKFILCFGVVAAIYLPIAWNGKGPWALPARAIRSRTSPDDRDASSDNYRLAENADLKITRDTSPLLGYGYGRPYIEAYFLPGRTDPFKLFLPHNGILWVWMRLGHFGFIVFWMFVFTTLIRGPQVLKKIRDPRLQVLGIIAIATLLMLIINGEVDLSFAIYRPMILTGTLLGILGVLPSLVEAKQAERAAKGLGRGGQGSEDDLDVREVGALEEADNPANPALPIADKKSGGGWEPGVTW